MGELRDRVDGLVRIWGMEAVARAVRAVQTEEEAGCRIRVGVQVTLAGALVDAEEAARWLGRVRARAMETERRLEAAITTARGVFPHGE